MNPNAINFSFGLFLMTGSLSFLVNAFWGLWAKWPVLYLFPAALLGLVLLLHAWHHLGFYRTLLFFMISGSIVLIAENLAIWWQPFGRYEFHLDSPWSIGEVPLLVLTAWGFFIYTGYAVSNGWLWAAGKEKPSRHAAGKGYLLAGLVLSDAFLITAIDLMLDPVQQFEKNWTWIDGGSFFGTPVGNYLGWLAVVGTSSFLFRIVEYRKPDHKEPVKPLFALPVLIYLLLAFFYLYAAYKYFGWPLLWIGLVSTLPLPLIILIMGSYKKSAFYSSPTK